jgi:3-hydroxyisobutyrate dehydrogenase
MAKDLRLSLEAEAAAGAPPALGKHATDLYQNFVNTGNGGVDFSDIINAIGGDA